MLDDAIKTARLRLAADLLLFRKTLHTLEGVVADIGAGNNRIDEVLAAEFLRRLAGEWPRHGWPLPIHGRSPLVFPIAI